MSFNLPFTSISAYAVTMLSALFFLATHVQSSSIDTQLQNAATNHTILWDTIVGWSDGPLYRGTSDVLRSCLVTLFASIYTAMHLDVPLHRVSKWNRMTLRLRWAVCCLVVPEIILLMMLTQYLEARKLYKKLTEKDMQISGPEAQSTSDYQSQVKYDMSYAFWVAMGGFVVNTSSVHGDHDRVALTTSSVAFLAQHGHYIDVPKDQITDRSKANAVAKFLVCVQVSWMLLQTFVRLGASYPITLLEIHTAIQVVCALLIYMLCWNKPFDVEAPLLVDASNFEDILAYMMMVSLPIEKATWPDHIRKDRTHLLERLFTLPSDGNDNRCLKPSINLPAPANHYFNIDHAELSMLILDAQFLPSDKQNHRQCPELSDTTNMLVPLVIPTQGTQMIQETKNDRSHLEQLTTLSEDVDVSEESVCVPVMPPQLSSEPNHHFILDSSFDFEASPIVLRRWELCAQALIKLDLVDSSFQERYIRGDTLFSCSSRVYVKGSTTSRSIFIRSREHFYSNKTGFCVASLFAIIHGLILLALWNFHFPSDTEALLWKISAIGRISTALSLGLIGPSHYFLGRVFPSIRICPSTVGSSSDHDYRQSFLNSYTNFIIHNPRAYKHKNLRPKVTMNTTGHMKSEINGHRPQPTSYAWEFQNTWMRIWTIISCFIVIFVELFFVFVTWYVLIESFISLRAVPLGALSTVPWVEAIPHI